MIQQIGRQSIDKICANQSISNIPVLIKELVDNSIDAKSDFISLDIDASGLKYIEIVDNGIGILSSNFEDLCKRGTTSKLKDFDDIFTIKTMGIHIVTKGSEVRHSLLFAAYVNSQSLRRLWKRNKNSA
jgi:DNA mismatch repair ATPase MutL